MGQCIYNTDVYSFFKLAREHRVYAYGAGKIKFGWLDRGLELCEIVDYIVDSNIDLQNKEYILEHRKYLIISPEKMAENITKDDIILITSRYYYIDIFMQIQKLGIDARCFVLSYVEDHFIHDDNEDKLLNIWKEKESLIPKKIHYCWFGKSELPEKFKKNIDTWKQFCPDYEIKRWDETNYNIETNCFVKKAYERKKWAFVSDYARLDILYNEGGFYFDTDVSILKNLDTLRYHKMFMGIETGVPGIKNNVYVAPGLVIGAIKEQKFLKLFMDMYNENSFITHNDQMDMEPIGVKLTRLLVSMGFVQENRLQKIDEMIIYPAEYFNARSVVSRYRSRATEYSYSIHWYEDSWHSEKQETKADLQELKAKQFGIKVQDI